MIFEQKGARFSKCRNYRYALWRIWDDEKPRIGFIGLNPSTANETEDDATIRRVVSFAKKWGYGGVYMLNLFAWRTPYPMELLNCIDPIKGNDVWIPFYLDFCEKVVFAWGACKFAKERADDIWSMFPQSYCLGVNKDGSPKHPLYLKGDTLLEEYVG